MRKCHSVTPIRATDDAGHQQRDAGRHHVEHAVAGDQVAGEEGRHEHAHDMDEDGDRRLGLARGRTCTMASGEAAITNDITPKAIIAPAQATM